jgi:hypothetical protein
MTRQQSNQSLHSTPYSLLIPRSLPGAGEFGRYLSFIDNKEGKEQKIEM